MPTLATSPKTLLTVPADAVVLAVAAPPRASARPSTSSSAPGPAAPGPRVLGADTLPRRLRAAVAASALASLGVTGKADEVVRVPTLGELGAPLLVLTGLGAVGDAGPTAEQLRRAAGSAVRQLAGTTSVALALPAGDVDSAAAVAEGALLGAYSYTAYRAKSLTPSHAPVAELLLLTPLHRDRELAARVERARVLAVAVAATKDLVNTPPDDLYPASFADIAKAQAAGLPVSLTVLDEQALARGGYGGILGVGQGSSRPPRLVKVAYAPRGAAVHLALVGKGITFDSGGLSLKPAKAMETMKCDMAGAAAVLSAVCAVARLGLPVRVTGWLALAENMPSGTAIRPSDVLTMRGGRTVEVLNTDAEGRLVLADALVAAGEEHPDAIVDVATLTGAQVVALGTRVSAVMAEDEEFRDLVLAAAARTGEQFWPMPLPEELRASMDSSVADIANTGDRSGGMLVAGLFLREFVPRAARGRRGAADPEGARVPWAHLDIAGPAFNDGAPHGHTGKGGSGVAVRTLVAVAEALAGPRRR